MTVVAAGVRAAAEDAIHGDSLYYLHIVVTCAINSSTRLMRGTLTNETLANAIANSAASSSGDLPGDLRPRTTGNDAS